MVTIQISERVAERLTEIAEQENRSVDEVAETILGQFVMPTQKGVIKARPGSGAALLQAALAADIHIEESDIASRSREILDNGLAQDLKKRLDQSAESDKPKDE